MPELPGWITTAIAAALRPSRVREALERLPEEDVDRLAELCREYAGPEGMTAEAVRWMQPEDHADYQRIRSAILAVCMGGKITQQSTDGGKQ